MSEAVPHTRGQKHEPGTRVVWGNGVVAVVQADGRHVIESSSSDAAAAARATPRYSKALGAKAAARAFNKYYSQKQYKSPRAKKAAMTRDLCHGKKAKYVRRTTAYKASRNGRLTGPGHYDYPGVDDGSRCPQNGGFFEEDEEMEQKAGARCGWNAATNRCVKGADNKMGWCELGGVKGTRAKPNRGRRCRKSPLATRFLGAPKAHRSPKGTRKAVKKSPRRSKRLAEKARKSPRKAARKSPKKKSKRGQAMKGYDYYDPMETRRKPGRKVKGAVGLAAIGYGGNRQEQQQQQQQRQQRQRQQRQRQQQQQQRQQFW